MLLKLFSLLVACASAAGSTAGRSGRGPTVTPSNLVSPLASATGARLTASLSASPLLSVTGAPRLNLASPQPVAGALPVIAHLQAAWTPGQSWTPPAALDETAETVSRELASVVAARNEDHGALVARMDGMVDALLRDLRGAQTIAQTAAARIRPDAPSADAKGSAVLDAYQGMMGAINRHREAQFAFAEDPLPAPAPAPQRPAPTNVLEHFRDHWRLGGDWTPPAGLADPHGAADALVELARLQKSALLGSLEQFDIALGGLFHDLNNALSIGLMTLPLNGDDADLKPRAKRSVANSLGKTQTILRSYEHLLRGRLGRLQPVFSPVSMPDVFAEAVGNVEFSATARGKKIIVEAEPGLTVQADPDMLAVVIANLLDNALKYTPERRQVALRAIRDEATGAVTISVADRGIGIARADRETVFAGRRTVSGRAMAPGTGTGLPLIRRLVEAMGSRVVLRGTVGRGMTFSFVLPAAS